MHWKRWARAEGMIKSPAWSPKRAARWKARNALTMGAAAAEVFEYREIFERDSWMCGICETPVDPGLAWPDPMSVSLDHIVPLSLGGAHSRENARCTHLVCNVRKGARVA